MLKDIKNHLVFIGNRFSYFGQNAYCETNKLPEGLNKVLKKGRGIKYTLDSDPLFKDFISWLKSKELGKHGNPRDMNKNKSCGKFYGKNYQIK